MSKSKSKSKAKPKTRLIKGPRSTRTLTAAPAVDRTGRVDIAVTLLGVAWLDGVGVMIGAPGLGQQLAPLVGNLARRTLPTKPLFTRADLERVRAQGVLA